MHLTAFLAEQNQADTALINKLGSQTHWLLLIWCIEEHHEQVEQCTFTQVRTREYYTVQLKGGGGSCIAHIYTTQLAL